MDFKILDWNAANNLKDKLNAKPFMSIDYNLSTVYQLNDSSYLIMPLNPFGNSLLTDKKTLLDKWVSEKYFPASDETNNFYFSNKEKIDNLFTYKEELKKELCNYVFKTDNKNPNEFSIEEIDSIYNLLKKRKKIKEYKLNFIVLVGDFILNKNKEESWKWGLLQNKQLLNPIINLIIVTSEKDAKYFNIEEAVSGKYGYLGIEYLLKEIGSRNKRSTNIEEIAKVFPTF